jgi:hypothetical protein
MALLFQSNPDQWDLRKYFKPGKKVSWFVTRYLSYMKPGTLTLLWEAQGGKPAAVKGLYGWGIIQAEPAGDERGRLRVPLVFIERWVCSHDARNEIPDEDQIAAISADQVFKLQSWRDHLLAKMPVGTNFLINTDQIQELTKIVAARYPTSAFSQAANLDMAGKPLDPDRFSKEPIKEAGDG